MDHYRPWHKAIRSDAGQACVEVSERVDRAAVRVRDSKDSTGPVLAFGAAGWTAFIGQAKAGGFVV